MKILGKGLTHLTILSAYFLDFESVWGFGSIRQHVNDCYESWKCQIPEHIPNHKPAG